jgi:hypothetical protein
MDVITIIGGAAAAIVSAVVVRVVSNDISDNAPAFAKKLIRGAVKRLPAGERDRCEEEWLAHLDERKGTIPKLCHAVECHWAAVRLPKLDLPQQTASKLNIPEGAIEVDEVTLEAIAVFLKTLNQQARRGPSPKVLKAILKAMHQEFAARGMHGEQLVGALTQLKKVMALVETNKDADGNFRIVARVPLGSARATRLLSHPPHPV